MLIYCRSVVIKRTLALRSLNHSSSIKKSLLHTSQVICGEEESKETRNKDRKKETLKSKSSEANDKPASSSSERRKQMLKAKFTKMDFISLDKNAPMSRSTQEKLKPEIDYQSLVKNRENNQVSTNPDRRQLAEHEQRVHIDEMSNQAVKSPEETMRFQDQDKKNEVYQNSVAFKIAQLIDRKEPEKAMKNLLDPILKNVTDEEAKTVSKKLPTSVLNENEWRVQKQTRKQRIKNENKMFI